MDDQLLVQRLDVSKMILIYLFFLCYVFNFVVIIEVINSAYITLRFAIQIEFFE